MDYKDYEQRVEKNRERNDKILDGFKDWLTLSGISKKTIDKHVDNANFYINEYLTYYDVLPAEDGYSALNAYFRDWFIRKATWASEYTLKENIVSLKKFYSYLKEIGMIKDSDYDYLLDTIRKEKAEWIREVNGGYEEEREAFYQSNGGETYEEYLDDLDAYKLDLRKFYTSIKEFSAAKPWEWLGDTDIFAIKFEDDDDTYFCCILGGGGQIYGMSIYRGLEGINSYLKTLEGDFDTPEEALHIMDAISIYLKDRKDITKEDYNMIQLSSVTFRGEKQWPVIRIFEPGFPPRLMDKSDLRDIVRVIEVITDYALYLKENVDKASLLKEGKYILREYDETGNYKEYIKKYDDFFSTHNEAYDMPILYYEIDLKRILKNCKKTRVVWEVDSFYYPTPVEDEGEIFYPAILMMVDLESTIIVGQHLTHPHYTEEFQLAFLEAMENSRIIPGKVIVKHNPKLFLLYDIFEKLNIEIEVVDSLEVIPQIKREMFNSIYID